MEPAEPAAVTAEEAEAPARADGAATTAMRAATARAEPAITATSFPDFGLEEMVEDNVSLNLGTPRRARLPPMAPALQNAAGQRRADMTRGQGVIDYLKQSIAHAGCCCAPYSARKPGHRVRETPKAPLGSTCRSKYAVPARTCR